MAQNGWGAALRAAFPYTVPIFAGFWFLGLTYGIYMHSAGFSFVYPMLMSMAIFAGSMEFIATSLLLAPFDPLAALLLTLMVNGRHVFYGISMLERYKGLGWKKPFLIFWLCDETFSINYTANTPAGIDRGRFYFCVSILNYLYWVSGATLGGLFGGLLAFDTKGLSFAMTAMFVVIFLEQWKNDPEHRSMFLGFAVAVLALLAFGPQGFMIPAMVGILAGLLALRSRFTGGAA